jgi:hypothetical protein
MEHMIAELSGQSRGWEAEALKTSGGQAINCRRLANEYRELAETLTHLFGVGARGWRSSRDAP